MPRIKVLALTFDPRNYWSAKYRTYAFGQYLSNFGFRFTYCPLCWQDYDEGLLSVQKYSKLLGDLYYHGWTRLRRMLDIIRGKAYDVVLLQRHVFPGDLGSLDDLLEALHLKVVYDFDDAVFALPLHLTPKDWKTRPEILKDLQKIPKLIRLSSHVVAGNEYLKQYSCRFNRNVSVVPTPVDTRRLQLKARTRRKPDTFVIGWLGTWGNLYYLEQLKPIFGKLAKKHKILIKIICSRELHMKDVPVVRVDWNEESEAEDVSTFDIAVMPLTDDDWARGKCGFKLLKYMSVGVPSVASAVGMNTEIIADGVNGFLARTDDEWIEKLSTLIDDDSLRDEFRIKGRSTVETRFSFDVIIPKFGEVLRRVSEGQ